MERLTGKVAIVTGGGSGIGRATAILFAREGARVVVANRDACNGKDTVSAIAEAGDDALFVRTDVAEESHVKKLVSKCVETYGRLDVMFNNAGILGHHPISTVDTTEGAALDLLRTNFMGVFFGCKHAIPEMLKVGGGSIINTASECAVHACPAGSVYSASKGAVLAYSRSLAMEVCRRGIRVNCVSPAATATPMHAELIGTAFWAEHEAKMPLARAVAPEDVAFAALYLASDESRYINAENILVDGGWTVRGGGALD